MAEKAMIGMSGGVDSSVAAYLVQQAGYDCLGATMQLHIGDGNDAEQARQVADKMNIPFHVFDFSDDFRRIVKDSFVHAYEQGSTPNPCVTCNRHLKFDAFLCRAQSFGCSKIVTGHYAQILHDENGRYLLTKAADHDKDQTYFLYCLTQEQLSHTLFPLGGLTKQEARQIAEEQGFINARKRDSQDICFVPDGDYLSFMKQHTGKDYPHGEFLDQNGHVIGRHHGAVGYTIGQRKGLGLAMGSPVYVCSKDMQANTVTVGPNEALFHDTLIADDWNWISIDTLTQPMRIKAKARSRMTEQPATVYPMENGLARVVFDEPQRAITPGQAVVLYDGKVVVGGGTILRTE